MHLRHGVSSSTGLHLSLSGSHYRIGASNGPFPNNKTSFPSSQHSPRPDMQSLVRSSWQASGRGPLERTNVHSSRQVTVRLAQANLKIGSSHLASGWGSLERTRVRSSELASERVGSSEPGGWFEPTGFWMGPLERTKVRSSGLLQK